jgi:lysophospholipase L1-like esterase
VLLGDSVFDNQRYVRAGESVVELVRKEIPATAQVTLLVTDGHTTRDISVQLKKLPSDATHLVMSIGGNDALGHSGILNRPAAQSSEVFLALAEIRQSFERDYLRMLDQVAALNKPLVLCTIYDPRFEDQEQQKMCVAALGVFNDVITRAAAMRGLPLVDLRVIFSQPTDYANPIEPAAEGGSKLAQAISKAVFNHAFEQRTARIYV